MENITGKSRPTRYALALGAAWTAVIAGFLAWTLVHEWEETAETARTVARSSFQKDVLYRRWNALQGGVYAPVTDKTPPNPYLDVAERDIETTSGLKLTLINPAYMTRQVHELGADSVGIRGHITSLKPVRPENAADPWETEALRAFDDGTTEVSSIEPLGGQAHMRLMSPLVTEQGCLKCHAEQGYKVGDIRGGITVAVPMAPLWTVMRRQMVLRTIGHVALWLLGLGAVILGTRRFLRGEEQRIRAEKALQTHARHQAVISELGQRALSEGSLSSLMNGAVERVAETLDVDYCKVLELLPDGETVLLRAGAGWNEGLVGQTTVPTGSDSQAGYTMQSKEPVIVEDLRTETRFSGPALLRDHNVVSGMSVIIGSHEKPWGVLGAHTTRRRDFGGDDVNFLQAMANLLADAISRKRAEDALRLTQFSVDRSRDAVYWMGPDARLIYVNDAACRSLGYAREELLTMTVHDVDPLFPREVWLEHWANLKKHGSMVIESTHRAKDGREFPVEIAVNYLEYEGKEYNCAFARDITERRRAEEEQLGLERQVHQAQKLESLGVLAGGIAHDFNNILMAVLGNADLALQDLSPMAPARNSVKEIERAARRAAGLVKQMLAYSGRGRFVVEPIDMGELVEEMTHLLEVSISKKAVLKYNFAENLPAFEGDTTQIRQIVMNLITNASEAIGDKSGVIAISTGAMDCDRECLDGVNMAAQVGLAEPLREGVYVYLEVADTGCGMDKETLEKVFDPFFTTKFTGRGLGMAAVLGIVRGHKGAINIYSEVGKGTTFKIFFPVCDEPAAVGEEHKGKAAGETEWRGSGTVLIADDEESVRTVGKLMLERLGFTVLTAPDGREAVDLFREHADEIICVLLDRTMPHLDGEQAFRELRRIRPEVKIILSSGYNEQDVIQQFVGKGLAGFIQKPYRFETLRDVLKEVLNQ